MPEMQPLGGPQGLSISRIELVTNTSSCSYSCSHNSSSRKLTDIFRLKPFLGSVKLILNLGILIQHLETLIGHDS